MFIAGYTKADGTRVRGYHRQGGRSRSKVRIPVRPGTLRAFGYSSHLPIKDRTRVLHNAVIQLSRLKNVPVRASRNEVVRKLNALRIFNKNRRPQLTRLFEGDMRRVQMLFPL